MDTSLSLAVLCCLLSASFAFPADLGYGGLKTASRPLSVPASARFNPLAVASPPRGLVTRLLPAPILRQLPAPASIPVVTNPIDNGLVRNVILDGSVGGPGDGAVVVVGSGGNGLDGGVGVGGLVGGGALVGGDRRWRNGDNTDSTVHVVSAGTPGLVGGGGGVPVVNTVPAVRPSVLLPNTVVGGTIVADSDGGDSYDSGVQLVSAGSVGVPVGGRTVVSGDLSLGDARRVQIAGYPNTAGFPTAVGGDLTFGEGSRIQLISGRAVPAPNLVSAGVATTTSLGSRHVVLGSRSVGLGSRYVGLGSRSVGLGSRSVGLGSRFVVLGSRSVGLGSTSVGLGSTSVGLGSTSVGLGSRPVVIGVRGDAPDLRVVRRVVRPLVSSRGTSSRNVVISSGGDTVDSS